MRTEAVCEISNSHNGSFDRCIRLIDMAKTCGASSIKFQCYLPEELVALRGDGPAPDPWGAQGWTMQRLYEKAQTPHDWFPDLVKYCNTIGMPWFSSVFGPESLSLLESLDCPRYKIASLDCRQSEFIDSVRATGKPLLASAPSPYSAPPNAHQYLYCPPEYPQKKVNFGQARFFDGFSYHGTDPLIPALSVAFGASIVEVHFQLFSEPSELESNISLYDFQFREMVRMIERIEAVS